MEAIEKSKPSGADGGGRIRVAAVKSAPIQEVSPVILAANESVVGEHDRVVSGGASPAGEGKVLGGIELFAHLDVGGEAVRERGLGGRRGVEAAEGEEEGPFVEEVGARGGVRVGIPEFRFGGFHVLEAFGVGFREEFVTPREERDLTESVGAEESRNDASQESSRVVVRATRRLYRNGDQVFLLGLLP